MSADFLLQHHAIELARNDCQSFAVHLETLRAKNRWVEAFAAVKWLSGPSTAFIDLFVGRFGPVHLLDSLLPMWRAWAAWRPNMSRLHFLEETAINRNDCLGDLLALGGPDFTNNRQLCLKEGLIAQELGPQETISWRSLRIELTRDIANELRSILD